VFGNIFPIEERLVLCAVWMLGEMKVETGELCVCPSPLRCSDALNKVHE